MSTILVTGATTPVGKRLVRALLEEPRVTEVLAAGVEQHSDELESLDPRRVVYLCADLTRSRELRALLFGPAKRRGVDTVVHLAFHRSAAQGGPGARRLHVEATRELLSLVDEHPTIHRVIYGSSSDVYKVTAGQPVLVTEEHPLDLSPTAPERVRDRIEADLTVCQRMGLSPVSIAVLRLAEILGPECGSQLHDYLRSKVALRPMGFDPMLNVLTVEDAVRALVLAVRSTANGIFNIPGADTLPLSETIRKSGRIGVALPGVLLAPAYQLRAGYLGMEFRYDLNFRRFHFSAVLDGTRARQVLGYEPRVPVDWSVGGPRVLSRSSRRPLGAWFEGALPDHASFAPVISRRAERARGVDSAPCYEAAIPVSSGGTGGVRGRSGAHCASAGFETMEDGNAEKEKNRKLAQ